MGGWAEEVWGGGVKRCCVGGGYLRKVRVLRQLNGIW